MSTSSEPREITAWVGWVWFAAWLVGLAGVFQIIAGLVAYDRGDEFFGPTTQVAVDMGYAAWGWIHIFLGIFLLVAAFSLAKGHIYGRVIAVLAATASAVGQVMFLGGPNSLWALLVIVMDLFVIWAVMVHGRELKREYPPL